MFYPFMTPEEHQHPFMKKGKTISDKRVIELWHDLRSIDDTKEIIKVCTPEFRSRGIANILIAYNGASTLLSPSYEHIVIHNYEDFIDSYFGLGHYDHDITVKMMEEGRPFFICNSLDIANNEKIPERVRAVEHFSYLRGIRICLTFSLTTSESAIAAIGLVARSTHGGKTFPDNCRRYGQDWWILSCLINSVICEKNLIRTLLPKMQPVKLKYLKAHGNGMSYKEIGRKFNLSHNTVAEYLKDMRHDFSAKNSRHAYSKAIEYGYYK